MAGPSPLNIVETQYGSIALVLGITNNGTQITFTGVPSFEFDSDELTSTWNEKEFKDTTGFTENISQANFKFERDVKINPSGSTRAAAALNTDGIVTLQNLVVSNYKVNSFNGTWRIKPGTKINLKADDWANVSIPCEKYVNAAQNTALTGLPIAG